MADVTIIICEKSLHYKQVLLTLAWQCITAHSVEPPSFQMSEPTYMY